MPRNFGKIVLGFWDNPNIRRLSEDAVKMLIYAFTGPNSTAAGTYILPLSVMIDHLQWPEVRVLKSLQELSKKPFVQWDRDSRVLYLPNWWQENPIDNPKVASHVAGCLMALPNCEYKARAINDLKALGRFPDAVNNVIGDWSYSGEPKKPDLFEQSGVKEPVSTKTPPAMKEEKSRAVRIDEHWKPTPEMIAYATSNGLNDTDVERETVKFVRYWTSPDASNPAKKDWHRTWCNWIDKAADRLPAKSNGHHANGSNGNGEFTERIVNGFKVYGRDALYKTGLDDAQWIFRAEGWNLRKFWQPQWGPEPGKPGCKMPPELLAPDP